MTLVELVNEMKTIANSLVLVNTALDGDIYDNAVGTVRYGLFNVDIESVERNEFGSVVSLYIYYADRLLQDKSNYLQLTDDAVNVLQTVLQRLSKSKSVIGIGTYTFTPFQQKFDDYLGGAYCRVNVTIKSTVSKCGME